MQHVWQFFRAGGVDQVVIRTGADIAHLDQLDQKLWVALACPTRGIEFDTQTLQLIDLDGDGRIRPPELLAACRWAVDRVVDPEVLAQGGDVLQLPSLKADHEDGPALLAEARRILALTGEPGAAAVSLAAVQERRAKLNAMRLNGDGVIRAETPEDAPALSALVQRIMDVQGAVMGCDDKPGVDRAAIEAFFASARALREWHQQAAQNTCVLALPGQALAATAALNAIEAKVEDFFARTRLGQFDAKAVSALSPTAEGYAELGRATLTLNSESIAALPLAPIVPGGELPLGASVNPAWADAVEALRVNAVLPLLGAEVRSLSQAQWTDLKARLAPCQTWLASRPDTLLGDVGVAELDALLEGEQEAALLALVDEDAAENAHSAHTAQLEKLIRYQRDLLALLNNFVSFSRFYRREGAAFQAGTLYLDARSCDLTVEVRDPAAHAVLAGLAKTYLAYCECRREGQTKQIVAAFTAGDVDYLCVGRNGVFYDRQGRDWDATITKLIENPTSVGQAFFSPYKKFLRMIEEQVAKRAAAKEEGVHAGLGERAVRITELPPAGAQVVAPVAAAPRKTDVGTVAAIGVALGSISAVLVGIFGKFVELGPWIPVALVGLVLAISGPSMLIAWLKLRQRSLGPILDASGWAINGRMNINLQLGRSLSQVAKVPDSARGSLRDPFADESHGRSVLVVVIVALVLAVAAWRLHWVDAVLPEAWQHGSGEASDASGPAVTGAPEQAPPAAPEASAPG